MGPRRTREARAVRDVRAERRGSNHVRRYCFSLFVFVVGFDDVNGDVDVVDCVVAAVG